LSSIPVATVGTSGGDTTQVLWSVSDALLLGDRTLVVANDGTDQLRFYSEFGEHVRDIARSGSGPAEFQRLAAMWRLESDTLAAFDALLRRVTWFAPDGDYLAETTLSMPAAYRRLRVLWPSRSQGFLVQAEIPLPADVTEVEHQFRDSVAVLLFDSAGRFLREVLRHPDELLDVRLRDVGSGHARIPYPVHFSPRALAVADSTGIWMADAIDYAIARYGLDGQLTLIARRRFEPVAVQREDVAALLTDARRRYQGRSPAEIRREMGLLEGSPAAALFPAFERLLLDGQRNLWVGPVRDGRNPGSRWDVFDSAGRLIADVIIPPTLTPTDVGSEHLVGSWRDALGVEYVSVYRLEK
jgi:hypothetical protein